MTTRPEITFRDSYDNLANFKVDVKRLGELSDKCLIEDRTRRGSKSCMFVCKDCNKFFVKLRKRGAGGVSWYIVEQCLEHDVEVKDRSGNVTTEGCRGTFEPGKGTVERKAVTVPSRSGSRLGSSSSEAASLLSSISTVVVMPAVSSAESLPTNRNAEPVAPDSSASAAFGSSKNKTSGKRRGREVCEPVAPVAVVTAPAAVAVAPEEPEGSRAAVETELDASNTADRYQCPQCTKMITSRSKHSASSCLRHAKKVEARLPISEGSHSASAMGPPSVFPVSAASSFAAIAQMSPASSSGTALHTLATLSTSASSGAAVSDAAVRAYVQPSPLKKRKVTGFGDASSSASSAPSSSAKSTAANKNDSKSSTANKVTENEMASDSAEHLERRRPDKPRTVCPRCQKDVSMRTRHPASACYKHARKMNINLASSDSLDTSGLSFAVECGSDQAAQIPVDGFPSSASSAARSTEDLLMLSTATVPPPSYSPHSTLISRISTTKHQIQCPECHKMISYRTRHPASACIKYAKKARVAAEKGAVESTLEDGETACGNSESSAASSSAAVVASVQTATESQASSNVQSSGTTGILQRCISYFS